MRHRWPFTPFKTFVIGFAGVLLWAGVTISLGWLEVQLHFQPEQHVAGFYFLIMLLTTLLSSFWDFKRGWAGMLGGGTPLLLFALQALTFGKLMVRDDPYTPLLYQILGYVVALVIIHATQQKPFKKR